jgi:UDP-glucose 4-epimerase
MRQRVLVTGGAGFIGSHLVDELAGEHDVDVVVVDNYSVGTPNNLQHLRSSPHVRLVEADVLNLEQMMHEMEGMNIVYHLATQCLRLSLVDPRLVHDVNTTGSLNVLRAAVERRVDRFVYVSSSEVYGTASFVPMTEAHPCHPTTVYGASKLAGEHYALAFHGTHGLPVVIVRPFNTYGPRSHFEGLYGEVLPKFVLRALGGRPPVINGDGEQTRDFTYVTDTARGIRLAARCDALIGHAVNIARGEEVSINQLAELVMEVVGRRFAPVHKSPRPSDVRRHFADVTLADRVLEHRSAVSIREGVSRYVEWFRARHANVHDLLEHETTLDWGVA